MALQVPLWLASLLGTSAIVVPLVRRAVFALGFGLVTYTGFSALLDQAEGLVYDSLSAAPASILALLKLGKVDVAIGYIFSAYGIKLGFIGLNAAGNLVRPRWRWND